MLEIGKKFNNGSFYHPQILCLIANAFINANIYEIALQDNICLLELGAYLIGQLKQQSYKISEQTLYRIAYAKRWDVTLKQGRKFKHALNRPASHYQSIIDTLLRETISSSSLELTVFNILLKALELAPQKYNEITTIKNRVSNSELTESLDYLVERLDHLDTVLKDEELKKQFQSSEDPYVKCNLSICMAINFSRGLNMEYIIDGNVTSFDRDELIISNLKSTEKLSNFIIEHLTNNGFVAAISMHSQVIEAIKDALDESMIEFCRDATKISFIKMEEMRKYLEQLIPAIESDFNAVNFHYEIFNQLLLAFKTAPLDTVSAELITIIDPGYKLVTDLKGTFQNFKNILIECKNKGELLESVLSLGSSEMYLQLQQMFRNFDERFAVPSQDIIESVMDLQAYLKQISFVVINFSNIINGKYETAKKAVSFDNNYLDHHQAYSLLREVRQHISNLNEKSLKFNIEKDKCFSFEQNLEALQTQIDKIGPKNEMTALQSVFLHATVSYKGIWLAQLRCMYTTNVVSTVEELKRNLQELESELSKIIMQREEQMQKHAATPPAHNRYKTRGNNHQGTPLRSIASKTNVRRKLSSSLFFNANTIETKKPLFTANHTEETNKENIVITKAFNMT